MKKEKDNPIIIYEKENSEPGIKVCIEGETVWQLFRNSEQLSM